MDILATAAKALPFTHLAITPDDAWSAPGAIQRWAEGAMHKGANGFMLRHAPSAVLLQSAIDALLPTGVPIICNGFHDSQQASVGLHFSSTAPHPATLGSRTLTGRSTHSLGEAVEAEELGYAYITYSPIFPTASHPGAVPKGVLLLEQLVQQVKIPVVALGGIGPVQASACFSVGASAVAAIRWFQ